MKKIDEILLLAKENNGIVTSKQITDLSISREHLRRLVEKGLLEKVERGVYILPTEFEDEMFNLQYRYNRGVFSHESALFLLGLSDRTPIKHVLTFPKDYNITNLMFENVKCYRVKHEFYKIGIIEAQTNNGNFVKIYSAERTLCDIVRSHSHTSIEIVVDAFKKYSKLNEKNINLLSEYAKIFRVEDKVRSYLEVLL